MFSAKPEIPDDISCNEHVVQEIACYNEILSVSDARSLVTVFDVKTTTSSSHHLLEGVGEIVSYGTSQMGLLKPAFIEELKSYFYNRVNSIVFIGYYSQLLRTATLLLCSSVTRLLLNKEVYISIVNMLTIVEYISLKLRRAPQVY